MPEKGLELLPSLSTQNTSNFTVSTLVNSQLFFIQISKQTLVQFTLLTLNHFRVQQY